MKKGNILFFIMVIIMVFSSCSKLKSNREREKIISTMKNQEIESVFLNFKLGSDFDTVINNFIELKKDSISIQKIKNPFLKGIQFFCSINYFDSCYFFATDLILKTQNSRYPKIKVNCYLQFYKDKLYSVQIIHNSTCERDSLFFVETLQDKYGIGFTDSSFTKNLANYYTWYSLSDFQIYREFSELKTFDFENINLKKWEYKNLCILVINNRKTFKICKFDEYETDIVNNYIGYDNSITNINILNFVKSKLNINYSDFGNDHIIQIIYYDKEIHNQIKIDKNLKNQQIEKQRIENLKKDKLIDSLKNIQNNLEYNEQNI